MAAPAPTSTPIGPHDNEFGIPNTPASVAKMRKALTSHGVTGSRLQQALNTYRGQRKTAMGTAATAAVPGGVNPVVRNPQKFVNNVLQGKGPAFKRLARLQAMGQILGYNQPVSQEKDYYKTLMDAAAKEDPHQAGSMVGAARDFNESPTFSAFDQYVNAHMDPKTGQMTGLTGDEANAIREQGMQTVNANAQNAMRDESNRLSAAGIDPRSGVAADRAMTIENQRQQDTANLEDQITQENLQRKQQFEGMTQNVAGAEENRRQFDVNSDLSRLANVEAQTSGLANLGETGRQFDVTYTEGQRQAQMARDAMARAAKSLQPSTLEKVGSGLSGFMGGLTGGGGGGGGGGGMGGF